MDLALQLGIAAGLVQLVAFVLYNGQILWGTTRPNTATWTLWAFLTIINVSSYASMTGDVAKYFLPLVSAVCTIITFVYVLFVQDPDASTQASGWQLRLRFQLLWEKFKQMDYWDRAVLAIGTAAGVVWIALQSATSANLIVIAAVTLAFWPLFRGVWRKPSSDQPLAWWVWTVAYALATVVVLMRWKGQYQDLVYPVTMLVLHPITALLTMRKIPAPV